MHGAKQTLWIKLNYHRDYQHLIPSCSWLTSSRTRGEGLNHDSLPTDEDHEGSKSESSITYESNVRCIPGGPEERKDMQDRLSVFDKYMFLLDNSKHVNGVKNTGKRKKAANASGTTK